MNRGELKMEKFIKVIVVPSNERGYWVKFIGEDSPIFPCRKYKTHKMALEVAKAIRDTLNYEGWEASLFDEREDDYAF